MGHMGVSRKSLQIDPRKHQAKETQSINRCIRVLATKIFERFRSRVCKHTIAVRKCSGVQDGLWSELSSPNFNSGQSWTIVSDTLSKCDRKSCFKLRFSVALLNSFLDFATEMDFGREHANAPNICITPDSGSVMEIWHQLLPPCPESFLRWL